MLHVSYITETIKISKTTAYSLCEFYFTILSLRSGDPWLFFNVNKKCNQTWKESEKNCSLLSSLLSVILVKYLISDNHV